MLRRRALLAHAVPPGARFINFTRMPTSGADRPQIPETKLSALSPKEFDTFNWMAVRIDYFVSSIYSSHEDGI